MNSWLWELMLNVQRMWVIIRTGILIALTGVACAAPRSTIQMGMQPEYTTHVPARTAVLPCQRWPEQSRYAGLPLSNAEAEEFALLCSRIDEFILNGFKDQPYMRGFSPKAVAKLLQQAGQEGLVAKLPSLWQHQADSCGTCTNAAAYYRASIAARTPWRSWLGEFSAAARNADALLLPFVTYAYSDTINDRGLLVARRVLSMTILLIDTNNGDLIWAGGRSTQATNQRLMAAASTAAPAPPTWESACDRLLTEDIWRQFPGRVLN